MSACKRYAAWLLLLGTAAADAQTLIDPAAYRSLVSDRRAYAVGDVVTVMIMESTKAQSAAGTGAKASTSITAGYNDSNSQHGVGLSVAGDTSGTGQTSRSGEVRANVAARITEKTAEGLLRLTGDQVVTINDEEQHVTVSGLVRPDDITADNTVASYRLADAKIEIVGDGVVASAQKQNIIYRALKWLRLI